MKITRIIPYFLLLVVSVLAGCQKEIEPKKENFTTITHKVAVVLPFSDSNTHRWRRVIDWACSNIEKSQQAHSKRIKLQVEIYDENTENIETLAVKLAGDKDIKAIIGPMRTENIRTIGYQCAKQQPRKTLIAPVSSSSELNRIFGDGKFFWSLSESDISQCEVLLNMALSGGYSTVSLLSTNSMYGSTFIDWFAFQAEELGLKVGNITQFEPGKLSQINIAESIAEESDCLICVPSSVDDVKAVLKQKHEAIDKPIPPLLFSDVALNPEVLNWWKELPMTIFGVALYADPESGFNISYDVRFNTPPLGYEAHLYDALMLTAFGLADCQITENTLYESLCRITQARRGKVTISWDVEGMTRQFDAILDGDLKYNISGASGKLDFDTKIKTCILESVYCEWMVYDGKFALLGYSTPSVNRRTSTSLANWNWRVTKDPYFEVNMPDMKYPNREKNWALLVAASSEWNNYRHQADILNIYQILRRNGYDDEHIVLVVEDDLANHSMNPKKGEISVALNGPNLYKDVKIDYKTSDLHPSDIHAILGGQKSARLNNVIDAKSTDNVFVFWSGHGLPNELCWLNDKKGFTTAMMNSMLLDLSSKNRYRKMAWFIETCYSGSVAAGCFNIPGVLCFTAANANEPSKADVFSSAHGGIWLSNRFTSTFSETVTDMPNIPFRDLYYKLSRNTIGSHVCVFNQTHFDNLFRSSIEEFIVPLK